MMKIKLIFLVLTFLLIIQNVLAAMGGGVFLIKYNPYPFGQEILINGEPTSNLRVSIINLNTSDKIETITNEKGQYIVDLANLPRGYSLGDTINITIYREEEQKSFTVSLKEEKGMFFMIDIKWEIDEYNTSEQFLDTNVISTLLNDQREKLSEDFDKKLKDYQNIIDIKADKRIKEERGIIIFISLCIASLFFVGSWFVTRHYAIKYSNNKR